MVGSRRASAVRLSSRLLLLVLTAAALGTHTSAQSAPR
jgi:hypothetical protein